MIQILNFFLIYAFLGWVTEVIYHAVAKGVVVNRGFLNGPLCPIYGFGMLLILYLLIPISDNLCVLFLGGMALTTSIELFGGWILEKLFHMRWWDYTNEPFNLHGYICLRFSIAWGLGVVLAVRILHTIVADVNRLIIRTPLKWLLIPACILFVIDIAATVMSVLHLQKELSALDHLSKEIRQLSDELTQVIGNKALETDQKLDEQRVQMALGKAELKQQANARKKEIEKEIADRRRKIQTISERIRQHSLVGAGRIVTAHPSAKLKKQGIHLKDYMDRMHL